MFLRPILPAGKWLKAHMFLNITGVLLFTIAAIVSFANTGSHLNTPHKVRLSAVCVFLRLNPYFFSAIF
jgi:hypothetical protein